MHRARLLVTSRNGAAAIEYALLAALVALALLGAVMGTGSGVRENLDKVPPALGNAPDVETEVTT